MDVFEAMRTRRSEHNFLPDRHLDGEDIACLLEMASLTPSGYNVQPWHFCLIDDKDRKKELSKIAFDQKHVANAALNIIVLGDLDFALDADKIAEDWINKGYLTLEAGGKLAQAIAKKRDLTKRREMVIRNSGLVTMSILLAAHGLGLGACPMMGFSKWKMSKFLNLPDRYIPTMLISIGYIDKSVVSKSRLARKSFGELVTWEKFVDES